MFCIHCGKQIEEGDRFCEFCGGLQEIAPETAAESQPEAAQQATYEQQPQTDYGQQAQADYGQQPQTVYTQQSGYTQQTTYAQQPQAAYAQQSGYTQQTTYAQQPQTTYAQQPQTVYTQQPQYVYMQPAVQTADPQMGATAPPVKKKKPPVALFVILGILLTVGIIVAIIVVLLVIGAVKLGKGVKDNITDYGKTQMESYFEENGMVPVTPGNENPGKETGGENAEVTTGGQEGTGDVAQGLENGGDIEQGLVNGGFTFDSVGRPQLSDFDWRSNADSIYSNPDVEWLDASGYQGNWKGLIIYSEDGSEEMVNFDVTVSPENVTLIADWYMVHVGGNELIPEEDIADTTLTGYEFGNGIHVENENAVIEITEFWEVDGKQYGKGNLKYQGSPNNEIYLVRP